MDLARGEEIPENMLDALTDDSVIKLAFNAQFERICLSAWLRKCRSDKFISHDGLFLSPRSWKCSMVWVTYLGMPLSLAGAGAVLNLGKPKLTGGRDLIRTFCLPSRKIPEDDLAA
ncbi:MAG: hypothetical protein LUF25_00935 [Phascolarctobacterium sp.]|nr:hypothetical protein [Phascolarctobacterium sp.]